jgi:chromosome segregation protein
VVGKNWVRAPRRPDNETGLLSREDEIDGLRSEVSRLVPATQALEDELLTVRERFRFLEQQQQTEQQEVHGLRLTRDEHRQSLADKEARFAQIETRRHQLASEMEELISELGKTGEGLDDARRNLALAENETGSVDSDREVLLKEKQQVSDVLIQARRAVQDNRDQLHRAELDLQGVRASLESIQAGRVRLTTQHQQTAFRLQELEHTLRVGVEPEQVLRQRLDELLDSRIEVETRLTAARNDCAQFDEALRDTQALVSECEQRVAVARDALQEQQLKAQELDVRMDTLREQIEASKYVLEKLLAELPDDAEESLWAEKSQQLGEKIAKIGPVNLVAIEEFEEQSERKSYLDKQHADLVEALDTLESAIKKIDRETRDRFKQTFDNLNAGFIEFFPRLFGGGNAVLELTEGDYLTAGVTVMARPPGKRNSTIHLLSGGEKALAAVALLFALFRLNPAPFCILDEVDAPLDDANAPGDHRRRPCRTRHS